MVDAMAPRHLTGSESALVCLLLTDHTSPGRASTYSDLSDVLVRRYDESECLLFVRPEASGAPGFTSEPYVFLDADGVPINAFLTFDEQGTIQELDLWKMDDSRIIHLPDGHGATSGGSDTLGG